MSTSVILLVLGAALLHATWNIIVKGGSNKLYEIGLNGLGGGLGAALAIPFLPLPAQSCWPLLALSCCFHLAYYFCVAATYRIANLSLAYPIMRGAAPMLTAFALCLMGSPLGPGGWAGLLLLCSGILMLALQEKLLHRSSLKGILFSLRVSFMIMGYTLADGFGAREAGNSFSFTAWLVFLNIFPLQLYLLRSQGRAYVAYMRKRAVIGMSGGLCGLASYGIAIWAMTVAPIALVAALRETSVIFGAIMAIVFLHEKVTSLRVAAILLVMAGAMVVRMG